MSIVTGVSSVSGNPFAAITDAHGHVFHNEVRTARTVPVKKIRETISGNASRATCGCICGQGVYVAHLNVVEVGCHLTHKDGCVGTSRFVQWDTGILQCLVGCF